MIIMFNMFNTKKLLHVERLNQAKTRVSSALSMFVQAKEEMINAKNQLHDTINNINSEIDELQNVKENAVNELGSYDKLIEKFSEFTL